jgi:hypothetical protein
VWQQVWGMAAGVVVVAVVVFRTSKHLNKQAYNKKNLLC